MEALLRHIHVIAPLNISFVQEKYVDEKPQQWYFMPCVLPSLSTQEVNQTIETQIKCGTQY